MRYDERTEPVEALATWRWAVIIYVPVAIVVVGVLGLMHVLPISLWRSVILTIGGLIAITLLPMAVRWERRNR